MLKAQTFSLQANKTREGSEHPDRTAQLARINGSVTAALAEQQPVMPVDGSVSYRANCFLQNYCLPADQAYTCRIWPD